MPLSPEELGQLLDRYWGTLVAWVGREHAFAEDVVQAAFIKLAAQSPPPSDVPAWLFQVTRRLALNELKAAERRRKREQVAHDLQANRCGGAVPSQEGLDREDLHVLLERLTPLDRQIVVARIWGELSFDQIAALVQWPKSRVWRTYQSALAALRSHFPPGD
jgi:RNA polymerase sigma-70 factor (ECF subfamily)